MNKFCLKKKKKKNKKNALQHYGWVLKKVNQKVNLGQCQMPARPDIAILKDRFF